MRPAARIVLTRALPAGLIVLGAGAAGFAAFGLIARRLPPRAAASAAIARPASALSSRFPAITPGPAAAPRPVSATLPNVRFEDRRGAWRRLSHWRGRPLLVNFWAPWCSPCRKEIPTLERLSRARAGGAFQVVGVAVDSRAAVLRYARRAHIRYPLLIGERPGLAAIHALGMNEVFPFSVFADARGRIVTLRLGVLHADEAELILERIHEIDRGRLSLGVARRQIATGLGQLAIARSKAANAAAGT
jgi:thiol-disulfide isomerase/thioredoxin